jgi:hypothetical protein
MGRLAASMVLVDEPQLHSRVANITGEVVLRESTRVA